MTYAISHADPSSLSTEEILGEIASFATLAAEVVARWASLLKELSTRRVPHPMFRHPVMQFWESITENQLAPEAAVLLADRSTGKMIRAVLPLSPATQINIAEGAPITVAMLTDEGEINSENIPIHRMDGATLKRAFGPDGIRPVHEQAEMIREEGKIIRHGAITILQDEAMIKIGNQKIKPEELRAPLLALGYSLDLTRNTTRKAG